MFCSLACSCIAILLLLLKYGVILKILWEKNQKQFLSPLVFEMKSQRAWEGSCLSILIFLRFLHISDSTDNFSCHSP